MSDLAQSWIRFSWPLLLVALVSGCGKPAADSGGAPGETGTQAETDTGKRKIIPVRRDVKELDGNWVMVITGQDRRDKYLWIVKLTKGADGKTQAEIVDSHDKSEAKIESSTIDEKSVHLQMKNVTATFDFQGEFDGIAVRGTVASGSQEMYLARLLPTSGTKLADYVDSALPPAADVFEKAFKSMQNQPQPKVILRLASEHRTSPIAFEAAFGLLAMHSRAGFDDPTLQAIIDQYLELAKIWGPRMRTNSEWICAQQLITSGRLPAEALKHLDEAEKLMGAGGTPLKLRFQAMREQAEIQIALTKSRSKLELERSAAHQQLQEGLAKQPFNWDVLAALADYAAVSKQTDAAIDYYSTIVALPMLEHLVLARRMGQPPGDPTPTEMLNKLWTEKHGNTDGLAAHLAKRHDERMSVLKTDIQKSWPAPPTEVGDHTVLVEFFTSGQSPPAVATEIAMDALHATFPTSQLVTLRYHQHNPRADGLVNQDSEDRFAYYELAQTPVVTIDGAILDPEKAPYRGFLQVSGTAYSLFRTVVDERVKQKATIRIELSGKVENDELSIQATVTGATEVQLPSLRLRLALAEEIVQSTTAIGIRNHAMVVREMPGGARGIAPKKGELKFAFTMPHKELQQHLNEYLQRYENGAKIEIPAGEKPAVTTPLFLIGWVQNDKSDNEHPEIGRAILQTAIVPITGLTATTAAAESATKPAETKATPPAPALPE